MAVAAGSSLFQQIRECSFRGLTARADGTETDIDMDISVRTKDKGLVFTVGLWNLNSSNWNSVKKKETTLLSVGWLEQIPVLPVCLGRIENSYAEYHNGGADTRYVVEGVDATKEYYSKPLNKTWDGATISTIVRDINQMATGGSVPPAILESPGVTIDGMWAIRDDRPPRYWLSKLVDMASAETGEQWEWDARAGKFYFHPRGTPSGASISLHMDDTLHFAEVATGKSEQDGGDEVKVEAYVDPRIDKNATVNLTSRAATGTYTVSDYEITSDTVSGDHKMAATLIPDGATHSAPYPGNWLSKTNFIPMTGMPYGGPDRMT